MLIVLWTPKELFLTTGGHMRIKQYYDEFFQNQYFRDFRCLSRVKKVCHAPKQETTRIQHNKYARKFILWHLDKLVAKYSRFYGGLAYYKTINDYQLANEDGLIFNHLFIDFDAHSEDFDRIKKQENDALANLKGKKYINSMDELQLGIQELIFDEDLLATSWDELKLVTDYLHEQGLKTYNCFSGSKGFHCRVFFEPIHLNNYNRIVNDLSKNLIKQFNLETLDLMVARSPSKNVERLPYTFNEKSGLRVVPFNENESLASVLRKSKKLATKELPRTDDLVLADYINTGFSDALVSLDKDVDIIVAKEEKMKQELKQQRKLNGTINGKYTNGGELFKDLRTLVRFICGDDNLVSSHERYDKYKCLFHEDKSPSAIVGVKNYTCYSDKCRIDKINYFDFIKEWFKLGTDKEVKEKMAELQELYDEQLNNTGGVGVVN